MPYLEFTKAEEGERELLPDGLYRVVVDAIEERRTRSGDEMWRVTLKVTAGGPAGPRAAGRRLFDNWAFSRKALPRMREIALAFGLDASRDREVTRRDFLGREAQVEVRTRRSSHEGRFENFIPYAGYQRCERAAADGGAPSVDEVPY
jgi:hypothetical protein